MDLQTTWSAVLNPVLKNPLVDGVLLKNITLVVGSNQINHKLGRNLQGWLIVRLRGAAVVYDTQDSNQMPSKTLLLTSDTGVNVDLWVF